MTARINDPARIRPSSGFTQRDARKREDERGGGEVVE
jgi:hypothetical protein